MANSKVSLADLGLNFGSFLLAAASASFAGYVIFVAPQAPIRSERPLAEQIIASTSEEPNDPITTGSTKKLGSDFKSVPPYSPKVKHYRIRQITSHGAIIDFSGSNLNYSVAIAPGDDLPNFGHILTIEVRNGNRYLVTDRGSFGQEGFLFAD